MFASYCLGRAGILYLQEKLKTRWIKRVVGGQQLASLWPFIFFCRLVLLYAPRSLGDSSISCLNTVSVSVWELVCSSYTRVRLGYACPSGLYKSGISSCTGRSHQLAPTGLCAVKYSYSFSFLNALPSIFMNLAVVSWCGFRALTSQH